MSRMDRIILIMTLAISTMFCAMLVTSARAQEPTPTAPEIIALSAEDAETCKTGGCKLITEEAIRVVREQIKRSLLLEEVAARQAEELKKKPVRTYCI